MGDLDFSQLTDDQLVTLIRAALQECVARNPAVQAAAQSACLDETEKARIAAAAAQAEAAKLRAQERERIAKEAAEKVRREAPRGPSETERKAANAARLWELKRAGAAECVRVLRKFDHEHFHVCVWNREGEKRVYIRKVGARFGQNMVEFFCTGSSTKKPGSLKTGSLKMIAEFRGVDEDLVLQEIRSLCESLCSTWTNCEFTTKEAL